MFKSNNTVKTLEPQNTSNSGNSVKLDPITSPIINIEDKPQEGTIVSKGCFIKGDITGDDNVNVSGHVERAITLKNSVVTIEKFSTTKADIIAKRVNISGNIKASEKIVITEKGNVTGNMEVPKIILKDGSYFQGNISMTNTKISTSGQKIDKTSNIKKF